MSETDSFIEEVSEEVRKDRLFAIMRKYGWIALLAVLLVVSGTAYREYSLTKRTVEAEKTGDAILAALKLDSNIQRSEALGKIESGDQKTKMILHFLRAAELADASKPKQASVALQKVKTLTEVGHAYTDLAKFKELLLEKTEISDEQRLAELTKIASSASPYQLLAEEQIALIELESGQIKEALDRLSELLQDAGISDGLRQRASQLLIVLGETPNQMVQ